MLKLTRVTCPSCHGRGTVSEQSLGKVVQCRTCGCMFVPGVGRVTRLTRPPAAPRPAPIPRASAPPRPRPARVPKPPAMRPVGVPMLGTHGIRAVGQRLIASAARAAWPACRRCLKAAAVVAVLGALGYGIYRAGSWGLRELRGGVPGEYERYLPDDVKAVAYCDVAGLLRQSREPGPQSEVADAALESLPWETDAIKEVFAVLTRRDTPVLVLRVRDDFALAAFPRRAGEWLSRYPSGPRPELDERRREGRSQRHYLRFHTAAGEGFVAKTGEKVFCVTDTEEDMKRVLRRLAREERGELDARLRRVLASVSGEDHYQAAREDPVRGGSENEDEPLAVGRGFSIGATTVLKLAALCRSDPAARRAAGEYEDMIETLKDKLKDESSDGVHEVALGLNVEPKGDRVMVTGRWPLDGLRDPGALKLMLGAAIPHTMIPSVLGGQTPFWFR